MSRKSKTGPAVQEEAAERTARLMLSPESGLPPTPDNHTPPLPQDRPAPITGTHKLEVGQKVKERTNPVDERPWTVKKFDGSWVLCSRGDADGVATQWFHYDTLIDAKEYKPTFTPAMDTRPKPPKAPRAPKAPQDIGDRAATLLRECDTLDDMWAMAGREGLDVPAVKAKIGHLNPGLQRMGIGNRLRKMYKDASEAKADLKALKEGKDAKAEKAFKKVWDKDERPKKAPASMQLTPGELAVKPPAKRRKS